MVWTDTPSSLSSLSGTTSLSVDLNTSSVLEYVHSCVIYLLTSSPAQA